MRRARHLQPMLFRGCWAIGVHLAGADHVCWTRKAFHNQCCLGRRGCKHQSPWQRKVATHQVVHGGCHFERPLNSHSHPLHCPSAYTSWCSIVAVSSRRLARCSCFIHKEKRCSAQLQRVPSRSHTDPSLHQHFLFSAQYRSRPTSLEATPNSLALHMPAPQSMMVIFASRSRSALISRSSTVRTTEKFRLRQLFSTHRQVLSFLWSRGTLHDCHSRHARRHAATLLLLHRACARQRPTPLQGAACYGTLVFHVVSVSDSGTLRRNERLVAAPAVHQTAQFRLDLELPSFHDV